MLLLAIPLSVSKLSKADTELSPRYDAPPTMAINAETCYTAVVHLGCGDIAIELLPRVAPVAVNNFVFLAKDGFYNGTSFHRVIPGFLAQAGDPIGNGRGGPGYRILDEISDEPFRRGTVGMANAGPNTNGSQFYILLADAPQLYGRYSAFGRVTNGMDVADVLMARNPLMDSHPGEKIFSIEVSEH